MADIEELRQVVSELKQKEAEQLTLELLAQGVDPIKVLEDGIVKGLTDVGARFEAKKAIIPDLVKGGIVAKACIPHVEAALPKGDAQGASKGKKILIGTMLSQHNIGKNLVSTFLSINGFEVIDMGSENLPWDFYEKAEEVGADMIAVSVMFIPALEKFAELADMLSQMGVRDRYKLIVGGAITNKKWADDVGADGWGAQAKDGVDLARELLGVA